MSDATAPTDSSTMRKKTNATSNEIILKVSNISYQFCCILPHDYVILSYFSFRFYNCVHGKAYELPCATSLIFDEEVGTCVRPEQASEHAKVCPEKVEKGKKKSLVQYSTNIT